MNYVLWKGVQVWDAYLGATFSFKIMCMWSIHDFPNYGLLLGCVTKGHVRCPPCGPSTESHSTRKLKKIVYCGSCHYLFNNHPYRRMKSAFNGQIEIWAARRRVFAIDTIQWGLEQESRLQACPRNRPNSKLDLVHK
jgi:hypothetical protein